MKVDPSTPHISPETRHAKSRGAGEFQVKKDTSPFRKAPQGLQGQARPALTVHKLKQAIADTPDVDMKKVETLRAEIQAGTYQVNANAVADKLVAEAIHERL